MNYFTETLLFIAHLSAIVTSYDTRVQQWVCESLTFLCFIPR